VDGAGLVDALESVGFGAAVRPTGVLEIEGMMCQRNCGSTVKACLESVPGVARAEVSFAEGLARVWANDNLGPLLPLAGLVDAVEEVGFGARVVGRGDAPAAAAAAGAAAAVVGAKAKGGGGGGRGGGRGSAPRRDGMAVGVFSVSGMSCASCVGNVEKFVSALDGVEDVRVALLAEKVS
ncbi:unnamed protein product, partial [Laminaria digitata]